MFSNMKLIVFLKLPQKQIQKFEKKNNNTTKSRDWEFAFFWRYDISANIIPMDSRKKTTYGNMERVATKANIIPILWDLNLAGKWCQ